MFYNSVMKTRLINSQYCNNDMLFKQKQQALGQGKFKKHRIQNSYTITDNTNTNRPAQAISFGGSAVSWLLQSKGLNSLVHTINKNEVAFNAIYSLIIAGMLKPALVLAQTGFDDRDGQMIATKNFVQSFVGSFLGLTIGGGFIKKIYDKMADNLQLLDEKDGVITTVSPNSERAKKVASSVLKREHSHFKYRWENATNKMASANGLWDKTKTFFREIQKSEYIPDKAAIEIKAKSLLSELKPDSGHFKIFKSNEKFTIKLIRNLKDLEQNPSSLRQSAKNCRSQIADSFESLWKNSTGFIISMAKAKISTLLLPIIVAAIFTKRNLENQAQADKLKQQGSSTLLNSKSFKEKQSKFSQVTGKNQNTINFTGDFASKAIDKSALAFEFLATSKAGEHIANTLSKYSKKPSARMGDIESIALTLYWIINTTLSKKIDPDQKLGLNAHTGLVTVVSSLSALAIDAITDPIVNKMETEYAKEINKAISSSCLLSINKEEEITSAIGQIKNSCSKLYDSKGIFEKLEKTVEKCIKNSSLNRPEEIKSTVENLAYSYSKKLSKFKSLLIFTTVVRFIVPVFTVKQSKKLKKYLIELSKKREAKKMQQNNTQETKKVS